MASLITARNLAAALGLAAFFCESAAAQNTNYTPGDLVLFFQKEGSTNTIYVSLGNTATVFRGAAAGPDAANLVDFLNINSELTAAFGAGWASDPQVYAGLAGVWGTSTTSSLLQNGDPHRTLYVSSPRIGAGTVGAANSTAWDLSIAGNNAMTTGANGITSMNAPFEGNYTTTAAVSPTAVSFIDDKNPVSGGVQGNAFDNTFAGGVQQAGSASSWGSFGAAGSVEFALDLYRILAKNNISGQVGGDLRLGSYEGTITVNSSGQVSFIAQGSASSPYTTWADAFSTALPNAADRLPEADPDNDGLDNLAEFVLGGNPAASDASVAPTLDTAGSNFVFSFKRSDDSESEVTVVFQYGSDLAGWTDAVIGTDNGTVGSAGITVNELGAAADEITVTIPKSLALNGKLFGRLKMTK